MQLTTSTLLALAAATMATPALAAPGLPGRAGWSWWPFANNPNAAAAASNCTASTTTTTSSTCMSAAVGASIVSTFGGLLSAFDAASATNLLSASNFSDYSDSINFIAGIPLGMATFPNATAFIYGQGAQPAIGFNLINIDAVTCDGTIALRWSADVGTRAYPAKGITVLNSALAAGGDASKVGPTGWQLTRIFTEFNSAAWIADIGGEVTLPSRS